MASTEADGRLQQTAGVGGLGKSTLVTHPSLSIPMRPGAKLPPAPSGQGAGQGGQVGNSSIVQGTKTNG
jgi:hypothetical protein